MTFLAASATKKNFYYSFTSATCVWVSAFFSLYKLSLECSHVECESRGKILWSCFNEVASNFQCAVAHWQVHSWNAIERREKLQFTLSVVMVNGLALMIEWENNFWFDWREKVSCSVIAIDFHKKNEGKKLQTQKMILDF